MVPVENKYIKLEKFVFFMSNIYKVIKRRMEINLSREISRIKKITS